MVRLKRFCPNSLRELRVDVQWLSGIVSTEMGFGVCCAEGIWHAKERLQPLEGVERQGSLSPY